MIRRSSRINKGNEYLTVTQTTDKDRISFLILIKLFRKFREIHKDELYKFEIVDVDQNSNSYCKSNVSKGINKRLMKEKAREEEGNFHIKFPEDSFLNYFNLDFR